MSFCTTGINYIPGPKQKFTVTALPSTDFIMLEKTVRPRLFQDNQIDVATDIDGVMLNRIFLLLFFIIVPGLLSH